MSSVMRVVPRSEHSKIPEHIKLGLMKNFTKALDKNNESFEYLRQKFSKISDAKLKKGIFVSPKILKLMLDKMFETKLNKTELN